MNDSKGSGSKTAFGWGRAVRAASGAGAVVALGLVLVGATAGERDAVASDEGPSTPAPADAPRAPSSADFSANAPRVVENHAGLSVGAQAPAVDTSIAGVTHGVAAHDEPSGACPAGMQEVEGDYCANVEQTCVRWLDDEHMRCAEFTPNTRCTGPVTHKRFCIDKYEYPNEPGAKPQVMKTWHQAVLACKSEGKRLCGESEWTLACEGEERLPYPYGYVRNSEACNIDKPHPDVDEKAIANPLTRGAEVDRLWQGEPSGARESCVSPFGVHDMTGNVDEWVVNESGRPFQSGLKGGYWGPVRDRCRPMTTAHNEDFVFYQIGFRCCEDAARETGAGSGGRELPGENHGSATGHSITGPAT